jgi:hypothetical protein
MDSPTDTLSPDLLKKFIIHSLNLLSTNISKMGNDRIYHSGEHTDSQEPQIQIHKVLHQLKHDLLTTKSLSSEF